MFVNEADFDDVPEIKSISKFSRPTTASNQRDRERDLEFEDVEDDGFGSAGLGNQASSRARMLAQQREIAMKKRQNSLSTGMVRSSIESTASNSAPSPMRSSGDGQFTPAIRQFSAPKSVLKDAEETRDRPLTGGPRSNNSRRSKYSDEEDEGRDRRQHRSSGNRSGTSRSSNQDRDNRRNNDFEEEEYSPRKGVRTLNLDDDTRDSRDRERDRRSGMYRDPDRQEGRRGGEKRSEYNDQDEYTYSGARSATKSRDNRGKGDLDDRDRDNTRGGWDGRNATGGSMDRDRYARDRDDDGRGKNVGNEKSRDRGDRDRSQLDDREPEIPRMITAGPSVQVPPDLSNMRRFLTSPIPRQCGIIQCYIRRNKSGTNKLYPVYSLYLTEGDVFLMASKKRPKNKTSNYLLSMDQNDLNRSGNNYLGKLRSNFVGTEFQIFDDGINPKDGADNDDNQNTHVRCEMGAVMYAANVLGSRGPRKMQVALPGVTENLEIIKWRDSLGPSGTGTNDDMLSRIKDRNFRDMVYLINKPPRWNDQVGAYVLNFNGRVTMASVKNFQLVDPEEQNSVVLQFGRVGKDEFTMDMQWPISPFQAFAVTLSSFDSKIACD